MVPSSGAEPLNFDEASALGTNVFAALAPASILLPTFLKTKKS
jgi:hypothetical protein